MKYFVKCTTCRREHELPGPPDATQQFARCDFCRSFFGFRPEQIVSRSDASPVFVPDAALDELTREHTGHRSFFSLCQAALRANAPPRVSNTRLADAVDELLAASGSTLRAWRN